MMDDFARVLMARVMRAPKSPPLAGCVGHVSEGEFRLLLPGIVKRLGRKRRQGWAANTSRGNLTRREVCCTAVLG